MKSEQEKTFTSTDEKLLAGGLERLVDFQKTGLLRPQSLQLAPEDACQLDCTWCSTKYREHSYVPELNEPSKVVIGKKLEKPNRISFLDACKTLHELMKVGPLKTVELTGGGDPSMYPQINELIGYIHDSGGLQVGMITNGIGLTKLVSQESLDKLSWLRVSLASFDPQNFKGNNKGGSNDKYQDRFPDLPSRIKGKLGFSYVWGEYSRPEVLDKIAVYAKDHQVDFVRIVPDCLNAQKQGEFKSNVEKIVGEMNEKIGKKVMFFQSKRYDVYSVCRIGHIKPFLNADGYFYHCSAVPLYNQAFTPHWRMGHMSEVAKIWSKENVGKFDTSKCEYGKCFYAEQNEVLDTVSKQGVHKDFI